MKNFILTAVLALGFCTAIFAQKDFEGVITYGIEYQDMPAEMEAMKSFLPNKVTMYVKDDEVRTEQMAQGSLQFSIHNLTDGNTTTCMDLMGQKVALVMTSEEIAKAKTEQSKVTFEKLDGKKEIAGYKCKKGKVNMPEVEGESVSSEVWYTEDFVNTSPQFPDVPGLILEYSVSANGLNMVMSASEIEMKKIDAEIFVVADEYEKTTQKEFMEMIGN